MIPPTQGRVVWYRPSVTDAGRMTIHDNQPLAASVAYVWNDRLVNLTVSDHNGVTHSRTSVRLLQDAEKPDGESCWAYWMPFQIGQAKKHEAEAKT